VVEGASLIYAAFQDGSTRSATILGKHDAADVAVLHADPAGLTLHPLTLASSQALGGGDARSPAKAI